MMLGKLKAMVEEEGGDPDCCHCQLRALLTDHLKKHWPQKINDLAVAEDIASLAGDLVATVSAERRGLAFSMVVSKMGEAAGVAVKGHVASLPPSGPLGPTKH